DFSDVKSWIDAKSGEGITDWEAYFKDHPEDLRRCASLVKVVQINRATMALYGISTFEEFAHGLSLIFTDESYESFREQLIWFVRKTRAYESERPIQTLDKKRKVTLFKVIIVPGYEKTWAKVLVTVIDITEQKQAEAALRESEERYRSIIENIRDVSYRLDKEDRLVMVSPSGAQTFGYASPAAILAKPVLSLWKHPEQRIRLLRSMKEHGGTVQDWEAEFVRKDGTAFWVSISAHLLTDEKGEYAGSEGIIRDITERKKMDAALKNALNKLNMLSSITRHDIQNQLLALRGYLELSRKNVTDKTLLDMINKEDAIAGTIKKQIEFSKYYENIGVNAPAWHDLGTLVRAACLQLPQLAGITVSTNIPPVEIYADALIGKVIYNLLENSLRHGVKVTRIDISFRETDDGAVITYEDNGIGILPQDRQYLFQKGFGKHTGLGLFLSQQILAITGLTLRETGEPGKGVRFEILVPKGEYRINPGQ
ncbi:MAG: PAS domain S-box protein, partial [Methanoregula sp.]